MLNTKEHEIYGETQHRGYWLDATGRNWTLFASVNIVGGNNTWRMIACEFASVNIVGGNNTWRMIACECCSSRVIVPHLGI